MGGFLSLYLVHGLRPRFTEVQPHPGLAPVLIEGTGSGQEAAALGDALSRVRLVTNTTTGGTGSGREAAALGDALSRARLVTNTTTGGTGSGRETTSPSPGRSNA